VNKFMQGAAILPLLAFGAMAQDPQADATRKMKTELDMVKVNMVGAVKGPVVKGMPYSGEEITETNQVLADGTRIHRETKTAVYRDSEGRTRRETPDSITISDPVAGVMYVKNPKTETVRKMQMASTSYVRRDTTSGSGATAGFAVGGGTSKSTFDIRVDGDGPPHIVIDGKELDPKQVEEMVAKAKAQGGSVEGGHLFITHEGQPMVDSVRTEVMTATAAMPVMFSKRVGSAEPLGKKNIEGVIAEGKRSVQTIETGEIGNDRPIQIVNESWFSEELGMTVMTKRTDPRNGDESFRLTNIRRGDPAPYLFQAPAGVTNERKM
jgi:hypothetical protein